MKIPAVVMRGGTSKGVFLHQRDLPAQQPALDRLLLDLLGSPDPMQIDGPGGSRSSTSKVIIVAVSDAPGVDRSVGVVRTARRLMSGEAHLPGPDHRYLDAQPVAAVATQGS